MNPNAPGDAAELAARIHISHMKIHRAVVARIWELSDGGLDVHEIASQTAYPLYLIRKVLQGGTDRPAPPGCTISSRRERD
jgi:hypothetical protein